ncbi:hypothetical protein EGW08_014164 [Elysia chlorotica]|uniref:Transmembrane protein n=1 Tax=Elysia chlorotica TaxID=188477 RepID=A0A3S0ZY72_ELYCH|nr:hypothetical protein EGW08_014164 [Elysia chlorotica]
MGSFWGHVDEGIFFILLAVWWMVCAFKEYIMSLFWDNPVEKNVLTNRGDVNGRVAQSRLCFCKIGVPAADLSTLAESKGKAMKPNIHYDVTICRPIPLEIIFKIVFPIVGFLGELLDGGVRFQDSEGHFVKLVYQQHMTIYGIFIIHSVTDLLAWLRAPLFPMFNYVTALLAFLWYGVAFYYHANMHGKEPVEMIIHVLPISLMFLVSTAIMLEMRWQEGVWTMVVRAYGVLTLGTWFSHVAFMLYVHNKFPGGERSNLDRSDPNNVTFVKAMFGMHLFVNLLITIAIYFMVYLALKLRFGISIKGGLDRTLHDYQHLPLSLGEGKFGKGGAGHFNILDMQDSGQENSPMLLDPEA